MKQNRDQEKQEPKKLLGMTLEKKLRHKLGYPFIFGLGILFGGYSYNLYNGSIDLSESNITVKYMQEVGREYDIGFYKFNEDKINKESMERIERNRERNKELFEKGEEIEKVEMVEPQLGGTDRLWDDIGIAHYTEPETRPWILLHELVHIENMRFTCEQADILADKYVKDPKIYAEAVEILEEAEKRYKEENIPIEQWDDFGETLLKMLKVKQ